MSSRKASKTPSMEPVGSGLKAGSVSGDYQIPLDRVQVPNVHQSTVKKVKKFSDIVPKTATKVSKTHAPGSTLVGDSRIPNTSLPTAQSQKTSPSRFDGNPRVNTTMDTNIQQNSDSAGSPYQANSHRRYSSALGDTQDGDKGRQALARDKAAQMNARSVASLSKAKKATEPAVQGDKSSLFAEIVSLRDSNTSSRQKKANSNVPTRAMNRTPGLKAKELQSLQPSATTPYKVSM